MTAPNDLLSLAARVEEADGADRELDCAIAVAALGFVVEPEKYPGGGPLYCYTQADGTYLRPGQAGDMLVRDFTASLDAAMTLLSEGSEFELTNLYGVARAHVDMNFEGGGHHGEHLGGNIILALLSAALKARAHTGDPT